jgi:hypothetical protein
MVAVLGVAVVATLAGAANYREMGSVGADLPQRLLGWLGAWWHPRLRRWAAPSAGTLRRVLIALDIAQLEETVAAWLREHADCDTDGWAIALDGKDLRGSWNGEGRLVLFSALTHRRTGADGTVRGGVTLGQIRVPDTTTETTQVQALLDDSDIAGALVTADAAHTCAETARILVQDCKADYLLTIKGNRPGLQEAAARVGATLITGRPDHVLDERGHGRISRWSTWSTSLTVEHGIDFPHAHRLAVIRRDVADLAGQPLSKEIVLVVTSRAGLGADDISWATRRHWGIENLEHRPRDTVWNEDSHQAYIGNGPQALAAFRNLALGIFSLNGITKIKQTVQAIGRNPLRAIPLITLRHKTEGLPGL